MLNRKLLAITTAAGLVAFGGFSSSVLAANATGTASATIVAPLTVVQTTAMNFGSISGDSASATTAVLDLANAVTSGDGAGVVPASGAATAVFTATGSGNLAIAVTFSAGDTLTGPGTAMGLGTFTDDAAANLTAGTEVFNVGATLSIGANQTAGAYSGTYTVTVNYN